VRCRARTPPRAAPPPAHTHAGRPNAPNVCCFEQVPAACHRTSWVALHQHRARLRVVVARREAAVTWSCVSVCVSARGRSIVEGNTPRSTRGRRQQRHAPCGARASELRRVGAVPRLPPRPSRKVRTASGHSFGFPLLQGCGGGHGCPWQSSAQVAFLRRSAGSMRTARLCALPVCLEAAQKLSRSCPEAAQKLSRSCPEAA
jgi:hypothetical protein